MISLLFTDPLIFVLVASALVICLSIHEAAHAYVATKLGDDTAYYLGRVTLNPLAHLDPVGTLFLIIAGFGWGKPVPFNPYNLKNPKRDGALIALAGPASNFLLATILSLIVNFVSVPSFIGVFLYLVIVYNLMLGIFNLIPIHPLDGFKVVNGLLPENLSIQWLQMAPYGIYMLLLLIFTDATQLIINYPLNFALTLLNLPSF